MGNQAARSMKLVAICLLLGCAAAASVVEDATNPDDFDPPELLKTLDVKLKGARAAFNAAEGKVEALGLDVARLKAELETIKDDADKANQINSDLQNKEKQWSKAKTDRDVKRNQERAAHNAYEEMLVQVKTGKKAECMDKRGYRRICQFKRHLCEDPQFGSEVQAQCAETCGKLPASCNGR